jgi:hypothetical protein
MPIFLAYNLVRNYLSYIYIYIYIHCAHTHCLQFEHSGNGLMSQIREASKVTTKGGFPVLA